MNFASIFKMLIENRFSLIYCLYRFYFRKDEKKAQALVKHIRGKDINLKKNVNRLKLFSEDGSGQYTHPDIVHFNNRYYLTATPYTFSNELIENPWIFVSRDGFNYTPLFHHPLDKPCDQKYRNHFSDPAFCIHENTIDLYYRKTTHIGKRRFDEIFYRRRIRDEEWSKPNPLHFNGNVLIAPSFVNTGDITTVFFVKDNGDKTRLYMGEVNNDSILNEKEVTVFNSFTHYCIWHVDIKVYASKYVGLFTYIEKPGGGKTELFYGTSENGEVWKIEKRIEVSCRQKDISLYKSTTFLVNQHLYAIVSGIDKYYRWFLYLVDLEGVL